MFAHSSYNLSLLNFEELTVKRNIIALISLLLVGAFLLFTLWVTAPNNKFVECVGNDTPRYCVD